MVVICLTESSGFGGSQELERQKKPCELLGKLFRRFCTRQVPGKGGLIDLLQILLFTTAQLCTGAKLISLP